MRASLLLVVAALMAVDPIDPLILEIAFLKDDLEAMKKLEGSDDLVETGRLRHVILERALRVQGRIAAARREGTLETPASRERFTEKVLTPWTRLEKRIREEFEDPEYVRLFAARDALDRMLDARRDGGWERIRALWEATDETPPKDQWVQRRWEGMHEQMESLVALARSPEEPRPHVRVRGIYGGMPTLLMEEGKRLADSGVNAVWIGERGITKERVAKLKDHGAAVFAEFNTLHRADYLKEHPDAAPVGPDGKVAPAPHGWQGICPTHVEYRRWRMDAFEKLLKEHEIDGVWLDYHHAHSSWERAEPVLPDTCFCERCLARFAEDTKSGARTPEELLAAEDDAWAKWRAGVLTDWVREFREILKETRPQALLGTFHCPWTEKDREGALLRKLGIDLAAQSRYLDVFSPMPYHARFGHAKDPAWISRQTRWLGERLGVKGKAGERIRIWPIVQLADWGEEVPAEQVDSVLDHATRSPATGITVFAWGGLQKEPRKLAELVRVYRGISSP